MQRQCTGRAARLPAGRRWPGFDGFQARRGFVQCPLDVSPARLRAVLTRCEEGGARDKPLNAGQVIVAGLREGLRPAVVTIRASATPAIRKQMGTLEPVPGHEKHGSSFFLCIENGQLHEIRLDGRLAVARVTEGE